MTNVTDGRGRIRAKLVALAGFLLFLPASLAFAAPASAASASDDPETQVVAQLHLLDLKCLFENDSFGSDEAYININGQRVWARGNVDAGDIELVNLRFNFDEVITVELWEDDGGLTGGDDHMATWHIFASENGLGILTVPSQFSAGRYELRYEVVNP